MIGSWPTNILYDNGQSAREFAGAYVTANAFQFLGVDPLLGRGLTPADGNPGSPPVFVMNYKLWKGQFHGDRKLLGTTLVLNQEPHTLVGIKPPRFQYADALLWLPLNVSARGFGSPTNGVNQPDFLAPLGLGRPGISLEVDAANLNVIAQPISKNYGRGYFKGFTVVTDTLTNSVVRQFKGLLYTLFAAVMMLLLIACSNVANLMLARTAARDKEVAVRAAIGASRSRLLGQVMLESLVLAGMGGSIGCLVAYGGLKAVVAVIPQDSIPSSAIIALNPAVLLFALAVTWND